MDKRKGLIPLDWSKYLDKTMSKEYDEEIGYASKNIFDGSDCW